MIFKQIDEILDGRKTQTRRVVKAGEYLTTAHVRTEKRGVRKAVTAVETRARFKWVVGSQQAIVPGRGKPGIGRKIRFIAIRWEPLQDITEADARAEGVDSVEEYKQLWELINGKTKGARWDDNPIVWVITFEVVK